MSNQKIAGILSEIADFLEAKGVAFKPEAYRRAAQYVGHARREMKEIYAEGGEKALEDLPEIGKSIAKKIAELLKAGKLGYYERLKKKLPVAMGEMTAVEGIGPKMVKTLYKKLKVRNLEELERAARSGLIRELPQFGEKSEQKILHAIELSGKSRGRMELSVARKLVDAIIGKLRKAKAVKQIEAAGSLRRKAPTVGDLDLVVASDEPDKVMKVFVSLPEVERVYSQGKTKTLVRLKRGVDADLRVVPEKSFGAALQYFTGDKAHSVATRTLAQQKGMKLNEYGLFRGKKQVAGRREKEIYTALGLSYPPPEKRSEKLIFEGGGKT